MKGSQSNFLAASVSLQTTFWLALLPVLSVLRSNPFFSGSYAIDSVGLNAQGVIVTGSSSVNYGLSVLREQCELQNQYIAGSAIVYPTWITYGNSVVCADTWSQVLSSDNLGNWLPLACMTLVCMILCAFLSVLGDRESRKSMRIGANVLLLCNAAIAGIWTWWMLTSWIPFSSVPISIAFFVLAILHACTFPHSTSSNHSSPQRCLRVCP